ncbi:hypothetical protein ACHAWF_003691 [Thalassiosira exigua]
MDSSTMFLADFLNSRSLSGLPEQELKLVVNRVVILLRNMDIKAGHCNGTNYLVQEIGKYRLVLHKLDARDDDKNKVLILPKIPLRYMVDRVSRLNSPDCNFRSRLHLYLY